MEEMKTSYIDYAMSVIVSRALPDVRDGLKPVHRRILYAMLEEGLHHNSRFRKSATVVGAVLGRYHPHGDIAVYDSLVRMAQDFSLRYPLIQGQGNFGSIDADPPSAMRYSEARLSKVGEEMLRDIQKNTVDFVDNYDGTRKEPSVLPSPFPQILLNGSLGIAVGMATNIPPHNIKEVIDASIYLIDNPKSTTEDLFKFIKGPDFPTGGIIYDEKEIVAAYSQGKGGIVTRGKADIVDDDRKGKKIIITEIPYQVTKSTLVETFAMLVQEKKIDGIRDIRDESGKEGIRIVIELKKEAYPQKVLNRLYKFSDLQKTYHLNMLALVDGIQPRVLGLVELLNYYLSHKKEVVTKRTKYDLEKAKERAHILEGLHKCLSNIDAVIETIKKSESREDAEKNLMKRFELSQIQANAILETRLSALARLERQKIEDELKELKKRIEELTEILNSPARIKGVMKKELQEAKNLFGDDRRTQVMKNKVGEIAEADLIPQEETIITLTKGGYIKRINPSTYKLQKRGGKGIMGMETLEDDIVEHFLVANTHDYLLFFTDSGKVFRVPAYEIPEGSRVARGRGLSNFLEISPQDKILSMLSYGKDDDGENYMVMVTEKALIKRTPLDEFKNVRKSGLIAINLKKGDLLKKVSTSTGEDDIILITQKGQSIRFKEKDVRSMGRSAAGVSGIRLRKGDSMRGMEIVPRIEDIEKEYLLVVMENGYGKKTEVRQFRLQKRGGTGIKAANITGKTGDIVSSKLIVSEEDIIVISRKGQVIRTLISAVPILGRATQGVRIMRLDQEDKVASAAFV